MSNNDVLRNATYFYSKAILDQILDDLKDVAKEKGYALAVHGSLKKDIDLVAIPWVNYPVNQDDLANALLQKLNDIFGAACFAGDVGLKPHGRKAYTIVTKGANVYFDLSVVPSLLDDGLDNLHPDTKRSIMAYTEIKGEDNE